MVETGIEYTRKINVEYYPKDDYDVVFNFSKRIMKDFSKFIKAIVLFGSMARQKQIKKTDIDVLVVVDDVTVNISPAFVESYRIIVEKTVMEVSKRLHITTLKLSNFWEYVRAGDPVAINILRDGVSIVDTGFFEPLQLLLKQGRIRPTPESVYSYFVRSPATLHNSRWHVLQATLDLYWAVIDAAHAALMKVGEIPPSPLHVSDMLNEKLAKRGLISKKSVITMRNFYKLSKMILHREIKEINGEEYEHYYKEASAFIDEIRNFIEKK